MNVKSFINMQSSLSNPNPSEKDASSKLNIEDKQSKAALSSSSLSTIIETSFNYKDSTLYSSDLDILKTKQAWINGKLIFQLLLTLMYYNICGGFVLTRTSH